MSKRSKNRKIKGGCKVGGEASRLLASIQEI